MNFVVRYSVVVLLGCLSLSLAHAAPTPPLGAALEPGWQEIPLQLDIRNLTGPSDAGKTPEDVLADRIIRTNEIWAQCAIRFTKRSVANVSAADLKVPYHPKSQDDLGLIAAALNPNGFHGAIPFTMAGPWTFFDAGSGYYLSGLGWVFVRGDSTIDRIGAMVDAKFLTSPELPRLVGHELGHALSLGHSPSTDNLMNGGTHLTHEQCTQARVFAQTSLKDFMPVTVQPSQLAGQLGGQAPGKPAQPAPSSPAN